jgi:hypothetical protein
MTDLSGSSSPEETCELPITSYVTSSSREQKANIRVLLCATCRWTCTPKLAIALASEGFVIAALVPKVHPLRQTRVVSKYLTYSALRPILSLTRSIKEFEPDLIIPCDDRVIAHLHRLYADTPDAGLRRLISYSLGAPQNFDLVQSRAGVLALAAENGIRVPETRQLHTIADLDDWGRTQPFPWVLKVDGSWGGEGVEIVSDIAAARRAFQHFSHTVSAGFALRQLVLRGDLFPATAWLHQPKRSISVQVYIDGRPANCAVAAWNGDVDASLCVSVLSSDGRTGPASLIRVTKNADMLNAGAVLARTLKLSGLVGADFVIEKATQLPYLIELNPRATPICHLQLGNGRDLIAAIKSRITGTQGPLREPVTANDVIALFPQGERFNKEMSSLATTYNDAPWSDPNLIEILRRPPLIDRRRIETLLSHFGVKLGLARNQTWDA